MTAIAIWCNQELRDNHSLWIAADSRVSNVNTPLIEDAAKVLSLPIVCRAPGSNGFFSNIYYTHTLGYCFAGSTLMGQNSFLGLVPLLSNLISVNSYIPSLFDIGQHALSFFNHTFDDYKQRVSRNAVFEAAIFGFCHKENALSILHFIPKIVGERYQITLEIQEGMGVNDFIYLGDEKKVMVDEISRAFAGDSVPGRPLSRVPRYIIQDRIDSSNCGSIGGDIQLGIANRYGFCPLALCKPREHGKTEAYISYLGRELTPDIEYVGEARVSMVGMA